MIKWILVPLFALSTVQGATVLITGANRGLGLEFARKYKEKGYTVIGTAREPGDAEELNALNVQVEQLDVTDDQSVQALAKKLNGQPIDILINNAGVFLDRGDNLKTLDFDKMLKTFDVNSVGPMRLTQALLPNIKKGKEKKIINITSQLGSIENNSGGMYSYRASKAALNQLTKTTASEVRGDQIIVLALHPGWVRTDMGGPGGNYSPEQSVIRMIKVIDEAGIGKSGDFLDLSGNTLPW